MPDAVSSAPTSSESAPPGITVTPNLGAEPTARRSGRKRKEREELKDLSAALSACTCGSSAAPLDSSEHPNVVRRDLHTFVRVPDALYSRRQLRMIIANSSEMRHFEMTRRQTPAAIWETKTTQNERRNRLHRAREKERRERGKMTSRKTKM
ncbi:hypothetical protein B0H10DRAFT_2195078 [Mycena sp. CBHHK59/15]|nr:hypothetical protein B0H10DRAFT_2195078 [Mycena sp. CBHHK59/15]